MSRPRQPIETLWPEMEGLESDLRGPGMSGNIRGDQLHGLMQHIRDLREQNAALSAKTEPKGRRTAKATADVARLKVLGEVIQAVDDIMESHPELWGRNVIDAVEAWAQQQRVTLTKGWREAVEAALGGATA